MAIILIIAAIAIPNLIRSKMAANEASAVASLRTINTAEVVYSSTYNVANVFSDNLGQLADAANGTFCASATNVPTATQACLIDAALAAAVDSTHTKSGYYFTYANTVGAYTNQASPSAVNSTGVRYFFTDQSAVIRANAGAAATASSTPI